MSLPESDPWDTPPDREEYEAAMGFTQTHSHSKGLSTERLAAGKSEAGALPIKERILARLEELPEGMTPDEFCEETNALINTIRRRFTDLWKEGKIRHHSETLTRLNGSGNECVVWVLGDDPSRKTSRHEQMKHEIHRLRQLLTVHGINPDQNDLFANTQPTTP